METPLTRKARLQAFEWHEGQLYGQFPKCIHILDVVRILIEFGYDKENLIIAAYLHDTIEDCSISQTTLAELFNVKVGKLVYACSGEGKNRKEKKACMISRLRDYPAALPIKMADRLANMTNCVKNNQRLLKMYINELPDYAEMFEEADPAMYSEMVELCKRGRP